MAKTKHHRKPACMSGGNNKRNIVRIPDKFHRAYHLLFGPGDPHEIARRLNETYIDPDYELVVRRRNNGRGN